MSLNLNSNSPDETFRIGEKLGKLLKGREIIFLSGDLGAGKTLLTKGLGKAIGIDPREIVSPSYTIMNIYDGKFRLYHIDLYRIGDSIDEAVPEIDDNLNTGIIVVEWARFIKKYYSGENNIIDIEIKVKADSDSERSVSLSSESDLLKGLLSDL
ncbi:MAG: tRNA (adenosine(37)-N6)-threonylcarbamoyltransferase complex ATPase subunit type 1 TsaE [Acidobacteriota bacterium]